MRKMKLFLMVLSVLMLSTALFAQAQNITVSGNVTDSANGEPVAFASVHLKDTMTGVSTDADGHFSLSVPHDGVLVFSSIGYKTQENDTWFQFTQKYQVGDIVPAKIVSLMPFGAFAQIELGLEGLIHISQISHKRIGTPAEALKVGQYVNAKIMDIDLEKKKVELKADQVQRARDIYFKWQAQGADGKNYAEPELYRSVSLEELKENGYSLVPSRYIEFVDRDSDIDYNTVLTETASTVSDLLKRQKQNDETLRNALKQLGYECE